MVGTSVAATRAAMPTPPSVARSRLRTTAHHPRMQLLHRPAGGREKEEGQKGVDEGSHTGGEKRAGEAQGDVHVLEITLAHGFRMIGEKMLQGHAMRSWRTP